MIQPNWHCISFIMVISLAFYVILCYNKSHTEDSVTRKCMQFENVSSAEIPFWRHPAALMVKIRWKGRKGSKNCEEAVAASLGCKRCFGCNCCALPSDSRPGSAEQQPVYFYLYYSWQSRFLRVKCRGNGELSRGRKSGGFASPLCGAKIASRCYNEKLFLSD